MPTDEEQIQEDLESERALSEEEPGQEESGGSKMEKISPTSFYILLILCVFGDFIDLLTAGTIGWLVGLFIDGVLLLWTGISKGGRKQFKRMVVGIIGETIPVVSSLPFRTIFLIWSYKKSKEGRDENDETEESYE